MKLRGIITGPLFLMCVLLLTVSSHGYAADTEVERAMEQFRANRYRDAARLYDDLPSVNAGELSLAHLSLGAIFLRNAELYSELYDLAIKVHLDYLGRISSGRGNDRSRLGNLYMAETLMAAGLPSRAASFYLAVMKDPGIPSSDRSVARVGLGIYNFLKGRKKQAQELWSAQAGSKDPEVLSELASALAGAGLWDQDPVAICDKAFNLADESGKPASLRVLSNSIGVYAGAGRIDKALGLVRDLDMKSFTAEERLGANKTIMFYSVSLLDNLATLYAKAGIDHLKKAAADPKKAGTAQYYIGKAYAQLDLIPESFLAIDSPTGARDGLSDRQKDMVVMLRARNLYTMGEKREGIDLLKRLVEEKGSDPPLLAEAVLVCGDFNFGCGRIIKKAVAAADKDEDRKHRRLHFALGRFYLKHRDPEKAITYLEAGRDKSNKNRVEYNDPLLLIDLSRAYYGMKKFSEALEILFGMSAQFPTVRQIQNSIQGIYSMEQRSAGDVKVF